MIKHILNRLGIFDLLLAFWDDWNLTEAEVKDYLNPPSEEITVVDPYTTRNGAGELMFKPEKPIYPRFKIIIESNEQLTAYIKQDWARELIKKGQYIDVRYKN